MTREELLELMKREDLQLYNQFIIAPASSKHHGAREQGLLQHSIAVTKNLSYWRERHNSELTPEDCVIVGMLHDLCKADLYIRTKDGYEYRKELAPHHALKSIDMIEKRLMLKLTTLQRVLILLHMTGWENEEDLKALTKDDLEWLKDINHVLLVQVMNWADMKATAEDK